MSVRTICNLVEEIPFRRINEGDTIVSVLNQVSGTNNFHRDMTGTEIYHEFMKMSASKQVEANQLVATSVPDLQVLINEVFRIREQGEHTPASLSDARTTTSLAILSIVVLLITVSIGWHFVYHLQHKEDLPTGMIWGVVSATMVVLRERASADVP